MRAYHLQPGDGILSVHQIDLQSRPIAPDEVRVAMRATSLNYRDLQIVRGGYGQPSGPAVIPLSDGVGEVTEVGSSVHRFAVADRVLTTFYPLWIEGPITREKTATTHGGGNDGVLAEEQIFCETALVSAPADLSDAGAATLTCAGVTAWNALFVQGEARPGASVLILGTGGVAVWALQLAVAAGLHPIVTSSSDEKLAIARSMGARVLVNYRATPQWEKEVLKATDGEGVDLVIEVGGENTLVKSIEATRPGGRVIVIGGVSGFGSAAIEPHSLILGAKTLAAVTVGSRAMLSDLVRFVTQTGIHPTIAREFDFDEAQAAYKYLDAGKSFGKVVIRVG
jgi:NADPH:quinone reductase-like Zn-dependent oxidoreductase